MKMEALKHQGQRTDLTLVQVGPKLNSAEKIAQDSGESDDFDWSQIQSEFDSLKDEFPS